MFKKVTEDAILPTKGTKYSACVDVYANEDVTIEAGGTKLVGLGIAIDFDFIKRNIPKKYTPSTDFTENVMEQIDINKFLKSNYIQLMIRSSLSVKGLMLANGVGVIDLDYKGEIKMNIYNPICDFIDNMIENTVGCNSSYSYKIKKGERIGQLILLEHKSSLFGIESEEERNGGFGSTGK